MVSDKMREEFEAWHKTELANFVAAGQMQAARVLSEFKQTALAIWEASRAAVVVEFPPAPEVPEDPEEAIDDSHMDAYHSAVRMRKGCAKSVEAAGLQVKP